MMRASRVNWSGVTWSPASAASRTATAMASASFGVGGQLNSRITANTSPAMPSMRQVSRVSALAIRASSSASPALNWSGVTWSPASVASRTATAMASASFGSVRW